MIQSDLQSSLELNAVGTNAPEFAAYQDEPIQMRSGSVGKSGFLRLRFERRGTRTILAESERRIPYLAQRALYCDEEMPDLAHVFVITTTGCVLQGDRLALEILLEEGAFAHVTTQSATKVHGMDANYAVQTQRVHVKDGAYLEYLPEPLIPHRASRFLSDTLIRVAPTASVLMCEIVQPGRKHHRADESFGATLLSLATAALRPDGQLLFKEKLLIEPQRRPVRQTGVMRSLDVFGNVVLCAPVEKTERIYAAVENCIDVAAGIACGVSRLPNGAGLIFKVLGRETEIVRAKVREFVALARREITGRNMRSRYFWR
ncbi:MAG: urease accessory protein UreD [Beijerinckiaceae bacterium]